MKNTTLFLLFFGMLAVAVSFKAVDGTETRSVDRFKALSVSGSITATLVKSGSSKVEIETKNCDPEDVSTEVNNGRLKVKFKKKNWGWSKKKAYVTVYYQSLEDIGVSAGAKIESRETVTASNLELNASSGGSMDLSVDCDKLDIGASSGGNISLDGKTTNSRVQVSSGGSIKAYELQAKNVEADASSGGSAKIWVSGKLDAEASSGGSIRYKGDPENKNSNTSSSGSVKKV